MTDIKRIMKVIGRTGKQDWQAINGRDIHLTYVEAEDRYGISNKQFSKAIDQLLAHGFITLVHLGGNNRSDQSVYGISEKWRDWKPGDVCEIRPIAESRGYRRSRKKNTALKGSVKSTREKIKTPKSAVILDWPTPRSKSV